MSYVRCRKPQPLPFRDYLPRTKRSPSALAIRCLCMSESKLWHPPTRSVNALFFFAFWIFQSFSDSVRLPKWSSL